MEQLQEKSEALNLYWVDTNTGKKIPAGVGFFNPEFGEYRLKVDLLPKDCSIYLKPITVTAERTTYRAETAVKKDGRFSHRATVGTGYSDPATNGLAYIELGPYTKALVLELKTA